MEIKLNKEQRQIGKQMLKDRGYTPPKPKQNNNSGKKITDMIGLGEQNDVKISKKPTIEELGTIKEQRMRDANVKAAKEMPVLSSYATVVTAPYRAATAIDATVKDSIGAAIGRKIDTNDSTHAVVNMSNDIRKTVGETYASKWFGGNKTIFGQNLGTFIYNAGMSAADNVAMTLTGQGILGAAGVAAGTASKATAKIVSALMSSDSAANSIIENKERGLDDKHAVATGLVSGAIEYLTEKFSLEQIMKEPKTMFKGLVKSFAAEGSEEITSDVAGKIADQIINGNNSQISQNIQNYKKSGLSDKEAVKSAFADSVNETLAAGLAGGISGAAISAGYHGVNAVGATKTGHAIKGGKSDVTVNSIVDFAKQSDDKNISKQANKISDVMEKGKNPSSYSVGKLYNDIAVKQAKNIEKQKLNSDAFTKYQERLKNKGYTNTNAFVQTKAVYNAYMAVSENKNDIYFSDFAKDFENYDSLTNNAFRYNIGSVKESFNSNAAVANFISSKGNLITSDILSSYVDDFVNILETQHKETYSQLVSELSDDAALKNALYDYVTKGDVPQNSAVAETVSTAGDRLKNIVSVGLKSANKLHEKYNGKNKALDTQVDEILHNDYSSLKDTNYVQKTYSDTILHSNNFETNAEQEAASKAQKGAGSDTDINNNYTHLYDETKVSKEYLNSVNNEIEAAVTNIRNGNVDSVPNMINVTTLNEKTIKALSSLVGFDISGYACKIKRDRLVHIENRHGANGEHDHSLSDPKDIARMGYVINNSDNIGWVVDGKGNRVFDKQYKDKNNKPSPVVMLSCKIDGTYCVSQAIPDSKNKTVWITSSRIQKADVNGQVPHGRKTTPWLQTPETPLDSSSAFDNSVHQNGAAVNSNYTQNSQNNSAASENFIDNRDIDGVGKKSVKAFQYEYPQIKPYYKEMAQELKNDINMTVKGEKFVVDNQLNGQQEWSGTKRHTSDAIAEIKDTFGASYAQINDALNRIIHDDGQENTALAKRIEIVIDNMLTNGYTDIEGRQIEPNADYISEKAAIKGTDGSEYANEQFDGWLDDMYGEDGKAVANSEVETPKNESAVPYTDNEKQNWKSSKDIIVYESDEQFEAFVEKVLKNEDAHKKIYFGKIPNATAQMVLDKTGVDISGHNIALKGYEIRKILLNSHGDEKAEVARGQAPITVDDLKNIPSVITNPDNVSLSKKEYEGKPALLFEKTIDGKNYVVAYVSRKHHDIAIQTMYKKRSLATAENANALSSTPETTSSTASSNIVSQDNNTVNSSILKNSENDTAERFVATRPDGSSITLPKGSKTRVDTLNRTNNKYSAFKGAKTIIYGKDIFVTSNIAVPLNIESATEIERIAQADRDAGIDNDIKFTDEISLANIYDGSNDVLLSGTPKVYDDAYVFAASGKYYVCNQNLLDSLVNDNTIILANENPNEWLNVYEDGKLKAVIPTIEVPQMSKPLFDSLKSVSDVKGETETRFSLNDDNITPEDIRAVQSIGRKSVNDFTSEDINKTENFARKYFREMGVKSPFFRAWFGDWRANDTTKITATTIDTNKNKIPRGQFINDDTGWNINVSSVGIGDTISHSGKEKISVMAMNNIDAIIKNAVLLDTEVSAPKGKKGNNTLFMHKLYALNAIGDKQYISKLTVEEYKNGNDTAKRFYNLKEIKMSPALGGLSENNTASTMRISDDNYTVSQLFDIVKTFDKSFSPKESSKVVNEDGTPRVVYHGTSENFTVFDRNKTRKGNIQGMFFSPWDIDAGGYGENISEYYINLRNSADESTAYKVYNMFAGQNNAGEKAREYLEKLGYDGVNNNDEEYIVFNPNQIKSATDNIGTFDGGNDDIRFSVSDNDADIERAPFIAPQSAVDKLSSQIDLWLAGNMKSNDMFELGKTPMVLRELGAKDLPIVMSQDVMVKVTGGKHSISLDELKKLPQAITDPIMIFNSATVKDAYVLLTELSDKSGNDVVVALHMKRWEKHLRVNRVASVYGKENIKRFVETQIKFGNLKYIDKNKSQEWSQSRGLQLPKLADTTPDNNSILYKEDIVNTNYTQNNEIYSNNTKGDNKNEQNQRSNILFGDGRRSSYESAGEPNGGIYETQRKNQAGNEAKRRATAERLRADGHTRRVITARSRFNIIDDAHITDDMRSIKAENEKRGLKTHFFVGAGEYAFDSAKAAKIDGCITGNNVYIRYDGSYSPEQLNKHELVHREYNTDKVVAIREEILNSISNDEKENIFSLPRYRRYLEVYNGNEALVWEEFIADTLAGMNEYSDNYVDTVTDYWYNEGATERYRPSEYAESIDAGGNKTALDNNGFGNEYSLSSDSFNIPYNEKRQLDDYVLRKNHSSDSLKKVDCKEIGNNFYVWENNSKTDYTVVDMIEIDGNEDLITERRKELKNGNLRIREKHNVSYEGRSGNGRRNNNMLNAVYQRYGTTANGDGGISSEQSASDRRGNIAESSGDTQTKYSVTTDGEHDFLAAFEDAKKKYGTFKQGETPVRVVAVPKQIDDKRHVNRFARTMMEAEVTPESAISEFERDIMDGKMAHEVITNKNAAKYAEAEIKKLGFEGALNKWQVLVRDGRINKKDFALGLELYNQCITNKDVDRAMKIAAELSAMSTVAGQTVQAARMLKKMSPDGQMYYLTVSVEQINNEFKKKLGDKFEDVVIDEELMKKFLDAKTEVSKNRAYDELCQNIADQIPSTKIEKWNALRYLSMLGNMRTHIRNIVGNAVFFPAQRLSNYVGAVLENVAKVDESKRRYSTSKSTEAKKFAEADFEAMQKRLQGVNDKYAVTSDIGEKRRIFKNELLEKARKKNFDLLEQEDMLFLKSHYIDALARIITARDIDVNNIDADTLESIREHAVKIAKAATYRDENSVAEAISGMQRRWQRNDSKVVRAMGLGIEATMPYKKTPLNIVKQGVIYSPVGLMNGVYKLLKRLHNGSATTEEVIDALSKGLVGTAVTLLGYLMAKLGLLRGGEDDKKKKRLFDNLVGKQSFSLVIGNSSYTIDWAVPAALPLFVGCELYNLTKDKFEVRDVTEALSRLSEPLLELSVFSGISDLLSSSQYHGSQALPAIVEDMATSYVLQAFPTLGGQFARIIDNNKREYYYNNKQSQLPKGIQRLAGRIASKVPFAGMLFGYQKSVDEWGREKTYGSLPERVFENTISPGYYSHYNYTAVDKELERLYEATGETDILPRSQDTTIVSDKVVYDLTPGEYTKVKRLRGQKSYELIKELIGSEKYKNMSDEDKVKAIKKCHDTGREYAKEQILDSLKENHPEAKK